MIVVDSSGWIEFFADGPHAEEFVARLRQGDSLRRDIDDRAAGDVDLLHPVIKRVPFHDLAPGHVARHETDQASGIEITRNVRWRCLPRMTPVGKGRHRLFQLTSFLLGTDDFGMRAVGLPVGRLQSRGPVLRRCRLVACNQLIDRSHSSPVTCKGRNTPPSPRPPDRSAGRWTTPGWPCRWPAWSSRGHPLPRCG